MMKGASKKIVRYQPDLTRLESIDALLTAIKAHRHITDDQSLDLSLKHLLPFSSLKNIDTASVLLAEAIMQGKHLCIIGDFDTDGATSTALAVSALRALGGAHVSYLVPNRFKFGYGLTPEIVAEAKHQKNPDLIITVDNGIASIEGVRAANALGIPVVITDHHLQGKELPEAAAIVNPNQAGDVFPSKNLAGVGVVFYVMMATRAALRERGWFTQERVEPNLAQFLDYVALGTFADVVPLDQNNRILVQQGLSRIRAGECAPGISALITFSKRPQHKLMAADLGFIIAPRLNAAGRMEDMSIGIECLLAKTEEEATALAKQLELLNQERRAVEADMQQDAYSVLQKLAFTQENLPSGICLYQEHWHQGVTGIIASRVKDRYARPTIAFAKINDTEIKGSGRSVQGIHIRDVLDQIATANPGLLTRFGGHAMAAGLSMPIQSFDQFRHAFDSALSQIVGDEPVHTLLKSDGELSSQTLGVETVDALHSLGPYGQAFPEPLFDGIFDVVDQRIVGGRHLKVVLKIPGGEGFFDGILFNAETDEWPNYQAHRAHVAYRLDVNEFNSKRKLQLLLEDIKVCC